MFAIVNEKGSLEVHTHEDDLCFICKNINKCPLINALAKEYVILHYSDIEIQKCGLFKK